MEETLTKAVADEEAAVTGNSQLKASKEQEQEAATEAIETKQTRAGELAVSVVQAADDIEDTTKEVADTEQFAKTLETQCGTKEKEWAEREKLRAEEIAAISDAIGMLNDDDALDVFKKAVPSALIEEKAGFLQRSYSSASRVQKAQAILSQVAIKSSHRGTIKLMLFSLQSKLKVHSKRLSRGETTMNGGFDEVTQMVDQMVEVEGKEQNADNTKQPWCNGEFDKSDREEKQEKTEIEKLEAEMQEESDQILAINDEVAALKAEIAELDKAVAEATEQRKEEHEDYSEGIQLSSTATELVKKAKNRLQKFYNPTLYKAAPV
jgi:chromosome segregation ATPase